MVIVAVDVPSSVKFGPNPMDPISWGAGMILSGNQTWQCKIPSGQLTELRKIKMPSMGKLTISMAIFNSYVNLPKGNAHFLDFSG